MILKMRRIMAVLAAGIITNSAHAVSIAVLDSGVTPFPEIAPFVQPGLNAVTGSGDTLDPNGHGTLVSTYAIAASNLTATIVPVKISPGASPFASPAAVVNGLNFATRQPQVRVVNLSFGGGPFNPDTFRAMAAAVNGGKLLVMAAGNEGAPGPVQGARAAALLEGGGIAVGAIDNNGVIRPYSNRAGNNRNFYLVAQDDPLNTGALGTSFAAPVVSGYAALVMQQSPHLSGKQVASILFDTAIDLGAPGIDGVYGRGAVNIRAALSPIGVTGIPLTGSTSGPIALLDAAGLGVGAPLASALSENSDALSDVMILDAYERGFTIDLRDSLVNRTSSLARFFTPLERQVTSLELNPDSGVSMRIWADRVSWKESDDFHGYPLAPGLRRQDTRMALSLTGTALENKLQYRMDLNRPGPTVADALSLDGDPFLSRGLRESAFTGFGVSANSTEIRMRAADNFDLSFASVHTDESQGFRSESLASVIRADWSPHDKGRLMLQAGNLKEYGSLLGGSAGGAFSVDNTDSFSALIAGRWDIGRKLSAFGFYGQQLSSPSASELSLIRDLSRVRSESMGIGLSGRDLLRKRDQFGISLSRPLRVIEGSAELTVPRSRDLSGNTASGKERISLVPKATQTDLETYYYFDAGRRVRIGGHFVYSHNPEHSSRLSDSLAVFASVRSTF